MREIDRIVDQLRRAHHGGAWHGPAMQELLADVTAQRAFGRPLREAHSIAEIVLHVASWESAAARALAGTPMPAEPFAEDWPKIPEQSERGWRRILEKSDSAIEQLLQVIDHFSENRLSETVPGRDYSFYFLLHGIVQHHLYHAGQIALLKKA